MFFINFIDSQMRDKVPISYRKEEEKFMLKNRNMQTYELQENFFP